MKNIYPFIFAIFTLMLSPNAFADVRLAILEFRGVGVGNTLLEVLSDEVRTGVISVSKGRKIKGEDLIIMTRENMMEVLRDQGKTAEDCQGECEVEIAKNIGADYVISGTVTKIDELYVLIIKLHETEKSNLLSSKTIKTEVKTKLLSEAERVGALIFQDGLGIQTAPQNTMSKGFTGKELEAWKAGGADEMITTIDSKPNGEGVIVLMDGKVLCNATPCTQTISSGPHNISIQKKSYKEWSEQVLFTKGKNIKADLVADFGYLTLETNPPGIQFLLNREKVRSPVQAKILEKGSYQIQIDDPCHVGKQGQSYQFQIAEGDHEKVRFETIERSAGIRVRVQDQDKKPVEASLYVDGKAIGKSPGTFTIGVCSKELRAAASGQESKTKLKLVEQETATHELVLRKKYPSYSVSLNFLRGNMVYNPTTGVLALSGSTIGLDGATYHGFGARLIDFFAFPTPEASDSMFSFLPLMYQSPRGWFGIQVQYELHWLWASMSFDDKIYFMPKNAPIRHQLLVIFSPFEYLEPDGKMALLLGPVLALDAANNIAFGSFVSFNASVDF